MSFSILGYFPGSLFFFLPNGTTGQLEFRTIPESINMSYRGCHKHFCFYPGFFPWRCFLFSCGCFILFFLFFFIHFLAWASVFIEMSVLIQRKVGWETIRQLCSWDYGAEEKDLWALYGYHTLEKSTSDKDFFLSQQIIRHSLF